MKLTPGHTAPETQTSVEDTPLRQKLVAMHGELEAMIRRDNPGDWLWWWIAEDAFELPAHAAATLERAGPALAAFFEAANALFYRDEAIQRRLEKTLSPLYAKLNRARPDELPVMPRPDVVLDAQLRPRLVELEITVCARADTTVMSEFYGLDEANQLVRHYVDHFNRRWPNKRLAILAAPHPFWSDLADDANGFVTRLKREGLDVVLLTGAKLPLLRFDGEHLVLCGETPRPIHVLDRMSDIYELAEWQHPGMGAIVDAYLAGRLDTVNAFKQFLDEKEWMALFWDARLRDDWQALLGEHDALLREMIPRTWRLEPGLIVELADGRQLPVEDLGALEPETRHFIIKESGTSSTSSGAQSVRVLSELEGEEVKDLLAERLARPDSPYILQEIVDSVRIDFTALNPDGRVVVRQRGARVKLSAFYVDGALTDIKFIASNNQFTVNDSQCVEGIIRRPAAEEAS